MERRGRESQARIVTRSNCRLTQCLDGDEKDAAATAPMKGYPYSSSEPPRSWPQHQLVIAAKKKKKKKRKGKKSVILVSDVAHNQ